MNTTTAPIRAYHGDADIKAKYVQRFAEHRAADDVIQGKGYENGKGCFIGCTLEDYDHIRFSVELGWPEWLAQLADTIFEGIPTAEAPQFGTDLLDAVSVGADLDAVLVPFLVGMQRRNLARLGGNAEPYAEQCRVAIRGVIDFLLTDFKTAAAWSAESAARAAAWSVRSAAESAESAALSAAVSAAVSAAESAAVSAVSAQSAELRLQRDELLFTIRGMQ